MFRRLNEHRGRVLRLVHGSSNALNTSYVGCDCKSDSKLCEIAKLQTMYHFEYVRNIKEFKVLLSSEIFAG